MLSIIEGITAILFGIAHLTSHKPVLPKTDVFIILSVPVILCAAGLLVLFAWVLFSRNRQSLLHPLDRWIAVPSHLLQLTLWLVSALLVSALALLIILRPEAHRLGILQTVWKDLIPIHLWVMALMMQLLIWLGFQYPDTYKTRGFLDISIISQILLLQLVLLFSLLHWCILIFQLPLFDMLPGWFWKFTVKPYTWRSAIALLFLVMLLLLTMTILKKPQQYKRNLLLLIGLGYILQIGFGYIEGKGFEAIRAKYATSYHKSYAEHAADRPNLLTALQNYEEKYSQELYLGTKPPGVLLTYVLSQKGSALFASQDSFQQRFVALTRFITILYPLIAMLTLIPLYSFSRQFAGNTNPWLSSILYLTCPNVILIPLFLDQTLYPLLFMILLNFLLYTMHQQSPILSLICGFCIYLALYFTFSMLPVMLLAALWIAIEMLLGNLGWKKALLMLTGLMLGVLLGYLLLRYTLNYDILIRYQAAFERHRQLKIFESNAQNLPSTLLVNNLDIAAWSGFPVYLLFLWGAGRVLITEIKKWFEKRKQALKKTVNTAPPLSHLSAFTLAMIITYLGLNLFGQTRGEVGRIWLFLVPIFCFFASQETSLLCKRKTSGVFLVIVLQWMTVFLTYQYQDFFA